MKKGCLWTLLILVVLTMMCTVPYKKYKGYLFTNIRDGGIFELRATYDPSAALTAVSGNPYTLWLYFYTGGVFLDGHVLIKHIELSTASTGEKIYSRQEEIKLAFNLHAARGNR
jgi:hypothetical protein